MIRILGFIMVPLCVIGGYMAMGGKVAVLWQPFEVVIIVGAAVGAFMIANPTSLIKETMHEIKGIFKGQPYDKDDYLELLAMLYTVFKLARTKGFLALESHIENPDDSEIFRQFPRFNANHHARTFLCDYLRIISLGSENPHEMEALMDEEIETMHGEKKHASHAVQVMADGMPALGIVAAVLGVIKTMGSITEPPEVLGKLIGGALVGTFLGVWLSYGFIAPVATAIQTRGDAEVKYYQCMKVAILAFLQGVAPQVAVEFARKTLTHDVTSTFIEVEQATQNAPTVTG